MKCKLCEWQKNYEKIFENKHAVAVWGAPYVRAHVEVILKRHAEKLTDLSPDEASAMMDAWIKVGKAIESVIHPALINWQINCNWARHIHAHIYPRWESDPDWGEPIMLPKQEQVRSRKYFAKELSHEDKKRISDILFN